VKEQLAAVKQSPSLVFREKKPEGGQQQFIIFFSIPQAMEPRKGYRSSSSFNIRQKSSHGEPAAGAPIFGILEGCQQACLLDNGWSEFLSSSDYSGGSAAWTPSRVL
jgi:hypothetical protein